jgi:hypothetical protein
MSQQGYYAGTVIAQKSEGEEKREPKSKPGEGEANVNRVARGPPVIR